MTKDMTKPKMSASSFSKDERRLIVGALTACKPYLAKTERDIRDGSKRMFICHALNHSWHSGADLAKKVIMTRLAGNPTVGQWLHRRGLVGTRVEIQQYRHRWVDALIQEFSA